MTIETVEQLREFVKETKKQKGFGWADYLLLIEALTFALGEIERQDKVIRDIILAATDTKHIEENLLLKEELNRIKNVDVDTMTNLLLDKMDSGYLTYKHFAQAVKEFIVGGKSE